MASHLSTGSLVRANSYNINRFCYKFNQVPKRSAHHISCSSPPSNVSIIDAMALVLWYTSCAHIRFYIWELTVWDFQPLVNLKRMWSTQLQAFNCRYEHILLKFRAPRLIYDPVCLVSYYISMNLTCSNTTSTHADLLRIYWNSSRNTQDPDMTFWNIFTPIFVRGKNSWWKYRWLRHVFMS